jgi:hypothetical protein
VPVLYPLARIEMGLCYRIYKPESDRHCGANFVVPRVAGHDGQGEEGRAAPDAGGVHRLRLRAALLHPLREVTAIHTGHIYLSFGLDLG